MVVQYVGMVTIWPCIALLFLLYLVVLYIMPFFFFSDLLFILCYV